MQGSKHHVDDIEEGIVIFCEAACKPQRVDRVFVKIDRTQMYLKNLESWHCYPPSVMPNRLMLRFDRETFVPAILLRLNAGILLEGSRFPMCSGRAKSSPLIGDKPHPAEPSRLAG